MGKRDLQEQRCKLCREEKEATGHSVIECNSYKDERKTLDREIAKLIEEHEWRQRKEGSVRGIRTVLGLSDRKQIDEVAVKRTKKILVTA